MKISFLAVMVAGLPAVALAAPKPPPLSNTSSVTPSQAVLAANRAKAVVFFDGVVASYRKLHSLSLTWRRTGYDPAQGSLAWRHSKPTRVHYENKTMHQVFVSDGIRNHYTLSKETTGVAIERLWHLPKDGSADEFLMVDCDQLTPYLLAGQNPLRTRRLTGINVSNARLLGVATVKGVRCHGVELRELVEGRDSSSTNIYTAWFDSRDLMRRYQYGTVEDGKQYTVDFEVHPNAKLSPVLFRIPNRPDSSN